MEEENSHPCDYEGGAETEAEAEAEAGLRCQKSRHIQLQRERHRRRMAQFVAAALLLLLCGVLAVFLTFRLERPCGCAADTQTKSQSDSQSSGVAQKLQQLQSSQRLPIAMLTVSIKSITNGKLLWDHNLGEAYIDGGFRYDNGNLMVPRKGLYRVFLQTLYEIEINTRDCVGEHFLVLSSLVDVIRQSYPKPKRLLTAEDTVACKDYKDNEDHVKKSLFTSGIFKLDTNDKLFVTSSHPGLLRRNEHQSFFGAQLVFDDWSVS